MSEPLETSVKDIQDQINSDHPFGLKIWKPALYKKDRSVNIQVRDATRSVPGEMPLWRTAIIPGNLLWALLFGWPLAILYLLPLILLLPMTVLSSVAPLNQQLLISYVNLFISLSGYVLWPFGKFITRNKLSEEQVGLLSQNGSPRAHGRSLRIVNIWDRISNQGVIGLCYYFYYLLVLAPLHLIISLICTLLVFSIPMAKLNYLLVRHCIKHPLELKVHSGFYDGAQADPLTGNRESVLFWRKSTIGPAGSESPNQYPFHERDPIVLCLYRALGWKYYKYTLDYYVIRTWAPDYKIASHGVIFSCALLSTIPLAYFIGMAVSSITVQTGNIALGSVINATFGSIIEIILYCFAIVEGRELIVEGAIVGSILCGLLALPGVSMFSGGLIRKEQSFNAKAAGVSTTMLLMSVLGVYSPTVFQIIYGSTEIRCKPCSTPALTTSETCSTCISVPVHPSKDPVYLSSTRPFMYVCACALLMTYAVGLWFTLMTHTDKIYSSAKKQKRPRPIYQIFNFSNPTNEPGLSPTKEDDDDNVISDEQGSSLGHIRRFKRSHSIVTRIDFKNDCLTNVPSAENFSNIAPEVTNLTSEFTNDALFDTSSDEGSENIMAPHDSPNWTALISALILLGCTILYSLIAEILISSVDGFLHSFPINEKFLGLTLFAIAPTVTEFYNAISFATSGNIALSLEIGSAYVIQVTLLQIPVLVGFSAFWFSSHPGHGFTLIFPPWDIGCIFFSVFLLSYIYIEGKSNYFKGVILLFAYCLLMIAFLFVPVNG